MAAQPAHVLDPPRGSGARPHSVLFVDDEPANVRLMECIFRRRPGVMLLTAAQGSIGVQMAREQRPDLILLDLNLPDLSGDSVLRLLRGDPATGAIPVIMISGDSVPEQMRRMLDLGASGYITKPFDVRELLGLVDDHLHRQDRS